MGEAALEAGLGGNIRERLSMGVLEVDEDHGRRVPGEGLDAPDLHSSSSEVLSSSSPEHVPTPEGLGEPPERGQAQVARRLLDRLDDCALRAWSPGGVREERGRCR
eukprot:14346708-Alexandrium_andersonii.AAC.1